MQKNGRKLKRIRDWILIPISLLVVAGIGYVDFLTGDYSLLIFYAAPIAVTAWYLGDWGAIVIAAASGYARFSSDYHSYTSGSIRYWNSIEDMLFLLIVGLLVSAIKRVLDAEKKRRD